MHNTLTPATQQVLAEAAAIARSTTRCPLAGRYISNNYSQAHFNAQGHSARVTVPVAVIRTDETFLGVRTFDYAEISMARLLCRDIVAVYEAGVRIEDEPGEAEVARAARELAEEEAATDALRRAWTEGITEGVGSVHIITLQAAPRTAYCELPGANVAAWKRENGLLWEALGLASLSTDDKLRHAGASAVLGFEVSSYRVLKPRELRTVRLAVEAGYFHADWTLRQSIPSITRAA